MYTKVSLFYAEDKDLGPYCGNSVGYSANRQVLVFFSLADVFLLCELFLHCLLLDVRVVHRRIDEVADSTLKKLLKVTVQPPRTQMLAVTSECAMRREYRLFLFLGLGVLLR